MPSRDAMTINLPKPTLIAVNPTDADWTRHTYILAFGAYGTTNLLLWANSLDDALDEAIDYLADNSPGHIVDDQVAEEYNRAIAAGLSEEAAQERAEVDTTCGGNCGHYINAGEWGINAEDPSPKELGDYELLIDDSAVDCDSP